MHEGRASFLACAGLLALLVLLPRPATAAWPTDPNANAWLCIVLGDQVSPTIVSDGAGGAIVAWEDRRSDSGDIYIQRVSADGTRQWKDDLAICTAVGWQRHPTLTPDGAGGAIVVWWDLRSGNWDIYAQRVSGDGAAQWAADGAALCTAIGDQVAPTITLAGADGVAAAWIDFRNGTDYDIYAQLVSADGTVQWSTDGVALCTATGHQQYPTVISDGAGGAIATWGDYRNDASNPDIYAQRISAEGTMQWPADGVALCSATGYQYGVPAIVSDGTGGAIVTWEDGRGGGINFDIYAQRVSDDGTVCWRTNGVALCTAIGGQQFAAIASDGEGGAIVTWDDFRNDGDIYAQRISANGVPQWTANGVALCTAVGCQYHDYTSPPAWIASDGAGGAIVTWTDRRSGYGSEDIYAQRISASGVVQWAADGVATGIAEWDQSFSTLVSDGTGGAIVTWQDGRYDDSRYDIYAQRVQASGQLGGSEWVSVPHRASPAFALDPVRPSPSRGGALTVHFTLPGNTAAALELLDVAGRRIASYEIGSFDAGQHTLDLSEGHQLAPGIYLVRLTQGVDSRVARVVVLK